MAILPEVTRQWDDAVVNTWYDIRPKVVDNVLESTIFSLALKEHGCMKAQAGGTYGWTDTIGYGDVDVRTQRFQENSVLDQEVVKLDTMATAPWRFFCVDVNRSLVEDSKNMGKYQIKSYIARRLEAARNALVRDLEMFLFQWGAFYPAPEQIKGLFDICAPSSALTTTGGGSDSDTYSSGTSNGGISRANTWWRNWVMYDGASENSNNKIAGASHSPYSLNILADMRHLYNKVHNGQEPPNFIITTQDIYEAYEDEAVDRIQIVRTEFNKKAFDLGFESATYKGATITYSARMPARTMCMLNLNHVQFPYHPDVWFDMTGWKESVNQFERVAYIVCMTPGLVTAQPRRHGYCIWAS